MDEQSFDAFTRGLTAIVPRRRTIALLASVVSSLLVRGAPPVAAGCKKVGKKCDKNKDCCDGARCGGKECKCKSGFDECGGKCYDLDKDENHCGSCNTACAPGATCEDGACVEGGYAFVTQWGNSGSDEGEFFAPEGLTASAAGELYLADTGNHRIQVFTADGDVADAWGTYGSGDGEFSYPFGVGVDADGNVYVGDRLNNRIQKLEGDGTFLDEWGELGSGDSQFNSPRGVAVSDRNKIFVADWGNHRIQKFSADGTHLLTFGAGHLSFPDNVAVSDDGVVYAVPREWMSTGMAISTSPTRRITAYRNSPPTARSSPNGAVMDPASGSSTDPIVS
ncbi:MAG: repeat containing protein [Thermomicrobiales bacterium]|nr:repeat containing protein [Thermomicrobiales bacterium]